MTSHSDERPYPCEWPGCELQFKSDHKKNYHQKRHSKEPVPCVWPGCDKMFDRKDNMETHIRCVHRKVLRHVCIWPECGNGYANPQQLTDHISRHKGLKPYVCPRDGCDVRFTRKGTVSQHLRTVHKFTKNLIII